MKFSHFFAVQVFVLSVLCLFVSRSEAQGPIPCYPNSSAPGYHVPTYDDVLAVLNESPRPSKATAPKPCPPSAAVVYVPQYGPETSLIQNDSLAGWTSNGGGKPGEGWSVDNGILHLKGKGGDIVSEKEYENYVLDFDWTISKAGNSGIKYRYKKFDGKGWLGCEYQVLDDFNTPEGKKPKNCTGTLYDIYPTDIPKMLKPNDQINSGRVVVNGNSIQHWLNGQRILTVETGTPDWEAHVQASKFRDAPGFGVNPVGRIMVQDHQCEVWFHGIKIREIIPQAVNLIP